MIEPKFPAPPVPLATVRLPPAAPSGMGAPPFAASVKLKALSVAGSPSSVLSAVIDAFADFSPSETALVNTAVFMPAESIVPDVSDELTSL